jgi:spore germination protein YaaH
VQRRLIIIVLTISLLVLGGVWVITRSSDNGAMHPEDNEPAGEQFVYEKEGEVEGESDWKREDAVEQDSDVGEDAEEEEESVVIASDDVGDTAQTDVPDPGSSTDEGSGDAGPAGDIPQEPAYDPWADYLNKNYTSVHQLDEKQNKDKEFDFEQAPGTGEGGRTLKEYFTYVPPQNTYLNRTVMGFAPYWALDGFYQNYQMEHLSVIAYFGVTCYPDGTLVKNDSGWAGWNSTALSSMVTQAHTDGVKVVLTVKNFDRASIETLVGNSTYRSRLVGNILAEIEAKNVDGVNIDFEHIPVSTPVSSTHRANFASFIDQVADAVHAARPGSHVSVDILATSGINTLIYDVAALGASSVDSIMVMSYDFHSTSYYEGKKAGPESPLYGSQYWYTVERSMNDIAAQAPRHKIIMGIPYYGLEYPVLSSTWLTKNATVVGAGAITTYANVMDPKFDEWHNSSTIQWDDGEKMTWYRYRWPSSTTGPDYWQGYYDDPKSLGAKYDFVINKGLGGVGIWALGYDNGRVELWNTIRDKFSKEPVMVLFKSGVTRSQQQAIHTALGATVVNYQADIRGVVVKPVTKRSADLIADYKKRSEVVSADYKVFRDLHGELPSYDGGQ